MVPVDIKAFYNYMHTFVCKKFFVDIMIEEFKAPFTSWEA